MLETKYEEVLNNLLDDAAVEIGVAKSKFPTNKHLIAAATEEFGELVKAILDHTQKGQPSSRIYDEGVQAIAMVARLVLEGDPSVDYQGCI